MSSSPPNSGDDHSADIHRLLAHPMRRSLLSVLSNAQSVALDTLTEELVKADQVPSNETALDGGRDDIQIMLHHAHLPLMDDVGVLEYDPETNVVHVSDSFDTVVEDFGPDSSDADA